MVRLLVVVGLLAAFAAARVLWDRRRAALADRPGVGLPPLPDDLAGPGRTWIVFATRYCATCGPAAERLRMSDPTATVRTVLVEERPDLADRYEVRSAPTVVEADGAVVTRTIAGAEAVLAYASAPATA